MTLQFLCITLSNRSICQPRVHPPPPAPRHPPAVLEGPGRGPQQSRAPAVMGRKVRGCWMSVQAPVGRARGTGCAAAMPGGRHRAPAAAPSTGADPIPWVWRVVFTRNPGRVVPFGPSGRTATHRAHCAVLQQVQPSGVTFWEWCLEETEQNAPSLGASALARGASEDGVPSDTPHPASPPCWVKDQQHRVAAKGEPVWGHSQSLQRGTEKPPPLFILLLPPAQDRPGHAPWGWGLPLATSSLLTQGPRSPGRPRSPPPRCCSPLSALATALISP